MALAWLLHQGEDILPIPGTRKQARLTENAKAVEVHLEAATLEKLDRLMPAGTTAGATLM
ncbi:MAG: aldo/keto reductase [Desulfosarcinaceae bacterium]